ncbi:MAG: alpha/beta hydrolase family protein [Eubacteriales bacterium]|nr:alpha/beta hydrolase family protein [Eubacteriales bacterium]
MALLQINFVSQSLAMSSNMNVILPEIDMSGTRSDAWDGKTPLPVLYLLHGMSDDYSTWVRRTSIERYVSGKKLAVVMPDAANSFYSDEVYGYKYWKFISEELPEIVKSYFKISDKREDTYVAGLSMGSFGAAKLALNYPERYCKAAVFSGGIFILEGAAQRTDELQDAVLRIVGDISNIKGSVNDLPQLAKKLSQTDVEKPDFYCACGTNDYLYEIHRKMAPYLKSLGFSVVNHEEDGAYHNWTFWDKAIQYALDWMGIE